MDLPTILGAAMGVLVAAVARTYSRSALWWAISIVAPIFLLVAWRDWFGYAYWREASRSLVAIAGLNVGACAWVNLTKKRDLPVRTPVTLTPSQCDELTQLISEYHKAVNVASRNKFSPQARSTLKVESRRVSQWIRINLGSAHQQLFEGAAPVVEIYSAVPTNRMMHWQLAVGKLRYLQSELKRLCG